MYVYQPWGHIVLAAGSQHWRHSPVPQNWLRRPYFSVSYHAVQRTGLSACSGFVAHTIFSSEKGLKSKEKGMERGGGGGRGNSLHNNWEESSWKTRTPPMAGSWQKIVHRLTWRKSYHSLLLIPPLKLQEVGHREEGEEGGRRQQLPHTVHTDCPEIWYSPIPSQGLNKTMGRKRGH